MNPNRTMKKTGKASVQNRSSRLRRKSLKGSCPLVSQGYLLQQFRHLPAYGQAARSSMTICHHYDSIDMCRAICYGFIPILRRGLWRGALQTALRGGRITAVGGRGQSVLTVREVAALLNIHVNTVRRWDDLGVLKTVRTGPWGDRLFQT
jgi:excisionase family DNA binding protein